MKNYPKKRFLLIGKANAGKTLFILNFSEYMGYDNITIRFKDSIDEFIKNDNITNFKKNMVSSIPNSTKCLQMVDLSIPVFKGKKEVEFTDTTGISSNIHYDPYVRNGMVQTLSLIKDSYIICHIIDAQSIGEMKKIDDIDTELYRYGKSRGNYFILANKMDLKETSSDGFEIIKNSFPSVRIIKISALYKTGFNEVKRYVSKLI